MGINSHREGAGGRRSSRSSPARPRSFPLKQTISLALSLLPKAARGALHHGRKPTRRDGYLGQLEQIPARLPRPSHLRIWDCSRLSRKEIADRLAACGSDTIPALSHHEPGTARAHVLQCKSRRRAFLSRVGGASPHLPGRRGRDRQRLFSAAASSRICRWASRPRRGPSGIF
jgi:hypothetical protein